jgi:hypothetical protein
MSLLRRIVRWPKRHVALFFTLMAVMLAQPLAHEVGAGWALYDGLALLIAVAVLLFIFDSRQERIISMSLLTPAVLAGVARYFDAGENSVLPLELIFHFSTLIFYGYAAGVILLDIVERRAVQADDVIGALCSYLLLGLCWSSLYQAIELWSPGSFAINTDMAGDLGSRHARQALFNYFSFVTLTTLGYGDVTPLNHVAATFAWLEATFGQFYIAVVVAQVVGFRMAQAGRSRE